MKSQATAPRILVVAGLLFAGLSNWAGAQDLYKSRAEMLKAAADNKQANAAIIQAMAHYGKTSAETAKLHQETREKAVQNELLEAKVFYEKRAAYDAYRAARRTERPSASDHTERARRLVRGRPISYQQAGQTGLLRWPTLLKGGVYASMRKQIDGLLKSRTQEDSGAGSQNCVDTLAYVDSMKDKLRGNIRRYKAGDYLVARKFLDNIAAEAQQPFLSMKETLDKIAGR